MVLRVTDRIYSVMRLDTQTVNGYVPIKFEISPRQPQWSSGEITPNHCNLAPS
jgi:hypothetical protein